MRALKVVNNIISNIAIFDEVPEGWIEATNNVAIGWTDNGDGSFSAPSKPPITDEELAENERAWRNRELKVADIDILKAEDAGGDTASLRVYRQALRDYPQESDFPYGTRPAA